MDLSFLKRIFRVRQVYWNTIPEGADYPDGALYALRLERADRLRMMI